MVKKHPDRAVRDRRASNGKKDHLVVENAMVTAEFIGFLPRWRR
ncbi:hypothetical protein [Aeromonas aquatica]|nr:hypothetical protein [Aeromonas aquatica]